MVEETIVLLEMVDVEAVEDEVSIEVEVAMVLDVVGEDGKLVADDDETVLLGCTKAVTTLTANIVNKEAVLGSAIVGPTVHVVVNAGSTLRFLQVASTSNLTANE